MGKVISLPQLPRVLPLLESEQPSGIAAIFFKRRSGAVVPLFSFFLFRLRLSRPCNLFVILANPGIGTRFRCSGCAGGSGSRACPLSQPKRHLSRGRGEAAAKVTDGDSNVDVWLSGLGKPYGSFSLIARAQAPVMSPITP